MALINTLRNKMGTVVVVLIAFAILAFIAADLLSPKSGVLGNQNLQVGEIAGYDIQYQQYQNKIEEFKNNFGAINGRNPNDAEMSSIRNQAWEALFAEVAFKKEFDALGLEVSQDEVVDMVQGNNVSPEIQQAPIFVNPEKGQFDKNLVVQYLQSIKENPQQRAQWEQFENTLAPARLRLKYDNLLLKSNYSTAEEAKQEYEGQTASAEVKYLYIPFYSISDTTINVSDDQLEDYLNSHKEEFQLKESRSADYVSFPIVPSAADSAYFKQELTDMIADISGARNDSAFARANTDVGQGFYSYTIDRLPSLLLNRADDLADGQIFGPVLDGANYKLYKVSEIAEDTLYSARASHILFSANDSDEDAKAEAKKEAQRVLREIKRGADFAEMAAEHGSDGTASKGGDLGWFPEGRMVEEFQDAVFSLDEQQVVSALVETQFGYHIVKVTEAKTKQSVQNCYCRKRDHSW